MSRWRPWADLVLVFATCGCCGMVASIFLHILLHFSPLLKPIMFCIVLRSCYPVIIFVLLFFSFAFVLSDEM